MGDRSDQSCGGGGGGNLPLFSLISSTVLYTCALSIFELGM